MEYFFVAVYLSEKYLDFIFTWTIYYFLKYCG